MQDTFAAVNGKAVTQRIQACLLPRKHFTRHGQRVCNFATEFLNRRQTHAAEFHIQEADVKLGIMDNQLCATDKVGNLFTHLGKRRRILRFQYFNRQTMHLRRFLRHIAFGVDI